MHLNCVEVHLGTIRPICWTTCAPGTSQPDESRWDEVGSGLDRWTRL